MAVLTTVVGPTARAAPEAAAADTKPLVKQGADSNGDGYADLAVGARTPRSTA
ncbi:hypothetical protein [Streptomyces sp. NPDC093225]|uniref:hypothetical protein n=1 Tax=Streptomyces sp. NPDC093225 TaxID=3366034 RepID=UPI00380CAA4F